MSMRKNKGFTLIELLAVIVVLAIIALIATPIVLNIIESTKKGAVEQSIKVYIKSIEDALITAQLKDEKFKNGKHNITDFNIKIKKALDIKYPRLLFLQFYIEFTINIFFFCCF